MGDPGTSCHVRTRAMAWELGEGEVSDFRCFQCKYSDDPEWIKSCAKTYQHQRQELGFHINEIGKELTRVLTPVLTKGEAFLNRHLWLVDNRAMKFLDRIYEIELRIWRWFWK